MNNQNKNLKIDAKCADSEMNRDISTQPQKQRVLMIDNYDSFTWNVYQYLSLCGAKVMVYRNDKITLDEIEQINPTHLIISPGPGCPDEAGISIHAIKYFAGKIPIFGVCMGLQCMYQAYGGIVEYAGEIMHGKVSHLSHDARYVILYEMFGLRLGLSYL